MNRSERLKILLIEDETKTAKFLKQGLEEKGYAVEVAHDGNSGRDLARLNRHDLVITDLILPGIDGRMVCREIRAQGKDIPILMLTALGATEDVVAGLESGADDYLAKPFAFDELLARVRTLIRRYRRTYDPVLVTADLTLDLDQKKVTRGGRVISLTPKEFGLLTYFMLNRNRVIPKSELASKVWRIDFETGTNMVEVYVNYLRKKIDQEFSPKLIITHFGSGYELHDPDLRLS